MIGAHVAVSDLIAYQLGELDDGARAELEAHYFGCDVCTARLEGLQRLGVAVAALVRGGGYVGTVTVDALERAQSQGLQVRTYSLPPGGSVACTAAPGDDLIAVRMQLRQLAGDDDELDLAVETVLLERGATDTQAAQALPVDHAHDEVVLIYGGDMIRSFPRSRWTLTLKRRGEPGALADYTMNHTPWDELPAPE